MRFLNTIIFSALLIMGCTNVENKNMPEAPTKYVNPNIGTTHSRWFFYTPAAVPFGTAKLAPSTNGSYGNRSGWEAVGYEDGHSSIEGFDAIFNNTDKAGAKYMVVEVERYTTTPFAGIKESYDYLANAAFVKESYK